MLAFMILIVGIVARCIGHVPNFTPVLALALFGGRYLPRRYALAVPLALMVVSDMLIGWHDTLPFTWGSIVVIGAAGVWLRSRRSWTATAAAACFSAVFFFVVTNFGAWLSVLYPTTWAGLVECYTMAVPFFRATFLSTMIYTAVLFGLYEFFAARLRGHIRERVWLAV